MPDKLSECVNSWLHVFWKVTVLQHEQILNEASLQRIIESVDGRKNIPLDEWKRDSYGTCAA